MKSFLIVAFALAAASPSFAQQGGASAGPATANTAAKTDAQVGFQRKASLTPAEEALEGDRTVARMEAAAALIRGQLGKARAERDVVKTLCLNDKLSQADVATRTGRDRNSALKEAVGRSDSELANHEFTILSVLGQRSQQLTAEANQCIGEEAAFIGETAVQTTVDPTLPPPDQTDVPPNFVVPIYDQPPQCTTCSI
ncbi:MAG: hypothetical protein ABI551_26530 [Polyangiaceae bacterium]